MNWDAFNNPILWGVIGLGVLVNVPWSYVWSMLPAFKLPEFGSGPSDDKLIQKLTDIEQAIRDLGDKP